VPEAITFESVNAAPPFVPDANQARRFEDVEVTGGCRPAVGEALREIAGRQLAPKVREQLHDVAADFVRERRKHDFDRLERGCRDYFVGRRLARHAL